MCGIIAIASKSGVEQRLIECLQRLEYRGYDSAGIATLEHNKFQLIKTPGKVSVLHALLQQTPIKGNIGIGHTRWATHGAPSYKNSHPFVTKDIALVHNGVVENYAEIKKQLLTDGYKFDGDTDSEVLAQLIQSYIDQGLSLMSSVQKIMKTCIGLYSFVVISTLDPTLIIGLKKGLALAVGIGKGETYLSSDINTLTNFTDEFVYLDDNEIVCITASGYEIRDCNNNILSKKVNRVSSAESVHKGEFPHYMLKEIYDQPMALARCFNHYYNSVDQKLLFTSLNCDWKKVSKLYIIACGTSYYAACVAKYWIEQYTAVNIEVEISSEFRYKEMTLNAGDVFIFISQSGETADTLAALQMVKSQGLRSIAIVNREESSIANLADFILPIYAGGEIGVASTKSFSCTLMVLALLCIHISHTTGRLSPLEVQEHIMKLSKINTYVTEVLNTDAEIKKLSLQLLDKNNMIYIARGHIYPIALEAALKMKELSYIPALGIAAGELKHGPIALIDNNVPICVIAPVDKLFPKLISNVQESYARGGQIILFSDESGIEKLQDICLYHIKIPTVDGFLAPIIYSIPIQLLAYHFSCDRGHDVDQPRNLAKSVTVE